MSEALRLVSQSSTASAPVATSTSSVHRVGRGALALLSVQPVTWAASLLMVAYAPRYLGSVGLGQYAMLTALMGLAGTILGLGLPTVIVRRVAAESNATRRITTEALIAITGLGLLGGVAIWGAIRWFGWIELPPWTLEVTLALMVLTQVQAILLSVLTGQQRLGRFAMLTATATVATILLSIAALMAGGGLLAILVVNAVLTAIVTLVGWQTSGLALDWSGLSWARLRTLAWSGIPFAGVALVLRLRGDGEVFWLGLTLSIDSLGWWSAAERFGFIPLFVPTLIMTPLLPALSAARADRATFSETLRRSLDITVVLTFGACAAIASVAPAIPDLLGWSSDFVATIPLIELLSIVTPLVALGMILGTAIAALGQERRWFGVCVVACIAYMALAPLAIFGSSALGLRGVVGLAIVKILIEIAMVAGAFVLLPRDMISRASWHVAARSLAAGIGMIGVVRLLLPLELPLAIVGGALTYPALLLLLRTFSPSELRDLLGFVRNTIQRRAS